MLGRTVRFEWVKGHSGHPLNEAADRLANAAALSWKGRVPPAPGPGFPGAAAPELLEAPAPAAPVLDEPDLFSL
jgi:ribonuclease HI